MRCFPVVGSQRPERQEYKGAIPLQVSSSRLGGGESVARENLTAGNTLSFLRRCAVRQCCAARPSHHAVQGRNALLFVLYLCAYSVVAILLIEGFREKRRPTSYPYKFGRCTAVLRALVLLCFACPVTLLVIYIAALLF